MSSENSWDPELNLHLPLLLGGGHTYVMWSDSNDTFIDFLYECNDDGNGNDNGNGSVIQCYLVFCNVMESYDMFRIYTMFSNVILFKVI